MRKPVFAARLSLAFLYLVTVLWLFMRGPHAIALLGQGDAASFRDALSALSIPMTAIIGIIASHVVLRRFASTVNAHARLISDVSHDLRNSLAVMKMTGEVQLMRSDKLTPEESRHFIEGELRELDRMLAVINRLSGHVFTRPRRVGAPADAPQRLHKRLISIFYSVS